VETELIHRKRKVSIQSDPQVSVALHWISFFCNRLHYDQRASCLGEEDSAIGLMRKSWHDG